MPSIGRAFQHKSRRSRSLGRQSTLHELGDDEEAVGLQAGAVELHYVAVAQHAQRGHLLQASQHLIQFRCQACALMHKTARLIQAHVRQACGWMRRVGGLARCLA